MNWECKRSPQRMPKLEEQQQVRVLESKEQPRKAARQQGDAQDSIVAAVRNYSNFSSRQ